jgi:hypothetical protein
VTPGNCMSKLIFIDGNLKHFRQLKLVQHDEDLDISISVLIFCRSAFPYRSDAPPDDHEIVIDKLNLILNGNNGQKILAYKSIIDRLNNYYIEGLLDERSINKIPDRIVQLLGKRPKLPMRQQNLKTIMEELLLKDNVKFY